MEIVLPHWLGDAVKLVMGTARYEWPEPKYLRVIGEEEGVGGDKGNARKSQLNGEKRLFQSLARWSYLHRRHHPLQNPPGKALAKPAKSGSNTLGVGVGVGGSLWAIG
jgi:hypothetical protein